MSEKNFNENISDAVEEKICTSKFFNNFDLPEQYEVAELGEKSFGIIKLCKVNVAKFKSMSHIIDNVYLLDLENGNKCLLGSVNGEVVLSDEFTKIVKVLKEFVLIEKEDGTRAFIDVHYALDKGAFRTFEWYSHFGKKYEVFELPSGKKVVISSEDLKVSEGEYISINRCKGHRNINDKFVICTLAENGKSTVIRISDLKESKQFKLIMMLFPEYEMIHTNYVRVFLENTNKSALMRIDDFEISRQYDEIQLLSSDYARVKEGEVEKIVKLDDFTVAKWEKEE